MTDQSLNSREMTDLRGKSILVTGGTTGIGRATAILLASMGAKILIFGRHQQELDDALTEIRKAGSEVYGLTADTSKTEDVRLIFMEADSRLGGLDALVCAAALPVQDIASTSYEDMRYTVETNLLGYMMCAKEAISRFQSKGKGQIVFIGSMSADVREKGSSVYVATKAGIQGMAAALRKEVNEMGIKVSLIEPGLVGTDMVPFDDEQQRQKEAEMTMLKAEDIARVVYFCLIQPERVDVVDIKVKPFKQMI